jgi:3-hydroxyisobutyrate dehydrogenase-like beta-hydroxyacid dehydrogenase
VHRIRSALGADRVAGLEVFAGSDVSRRIGRCEDGEQASGEAWGEARERGRRRMIERVGFIGLGNMGKPMAINLARAGLDLTVYDVREEPLAELAELGAHVADSPREVGERSQLVETVVVDDAQVEQVYLGDAPGEGALAGLSEGGILVIHSTISPLTCRKIASAAAEKGVRVVDAAVSGGEERAMAGVLTVMVGGEAEDVEACRPIFEIVGENVFHVGGLGQGLAAKLCNNLMGLAAMQTGEEALQIANAAGIGEERMIEIASVSTADSWALRNALAMREMMQRHTQGPEGARAIGAKDLSLASKLARDLGLDLPVTEFFGGKGWR